MLFSNSSVIKCISFDLFLRFAAKFNNLIADKTLMLCFGGLVLEWLSQKVQPKETDYVKQPCVAPLN